MLIRPVNLFRSFISNLRKFTTPSLIFFFFFFFFYRIIIFFFKKKKKKKTKNYIERWFGENLKSVIVSTNLYITNQKGFPILTKPHESLIKRLFKFKISITIRGTTPIDNLAEYRNFLCYLFKK